MDRYLEQFVAQLTQLGVQVHWADDAAEARAIIASIANGVDAKVVVKGKSMATEEIQLNDHLEAEGYEVVETDLGEYIIQLAGESPSHIIAPAIHKTRKQIAELLHDKLQTPYTEVIPEMTQVARRSRRQQFFRADVGITGVNFAIAETGSVVIVTNEGNGRLSSTMPKVHVAVMGMEKVIPRLADLSVMLKVLTNSATGQKISSYVTDDDRAATGARFGRSGGAARGDFGQWPHLDLAQCQPGGALLSALWGVFERLSDLSKHRWTRLWLGVSGADWRGAHAVVCGLGKRQ